MTEENIIPEDRFQSRQDIMKSERTMIEVGVQDRTVLLTPILLDIRELLQELLKLNSESSQKPTKTSEIKKGFGRSYGYPKSQNSDKMPEVNK